MQLDSATGRIDAADWCPSPNFDQRSDGTHIDALIIHAISLPPDQFGGPHVAELFTNCLDPDAHPYFAEICGLRVSAHFLIRRDGALIQFVRTTMRAWHAGKSSLEGRAMVNDFSIGVELEGCDAIPFENPQYETLERLTRVLRAGYPRISDQRIQGHSDIAPGRKTDPGPCFDWQRYRSAVATDREAT